MDRQRSESRPWDFIRTHLLMPPHVPAISRRWLLRTAREAGYWLTTWEDALLRAVAANAPITLVIDAGFSGSRFAVYAQGTVLASGATQQCSLRSLAEVLAREEEHKHHVRFHPSQWYGQEWFTQQPAMELEHMSSVMAVVHRAIWHEALQQSTSELAEQVEKLLATLPAAARTEVARQGAIFIGGLASVEGYAEALQESLQFPIKASRKSVYASLRGS